jgi:ribonuclease HI
MTFYAVKIGKIPGLYTSWSECSQQVTGFPNSLYKKFTDIDAAKQFMSVSTFSSNEVDYYVYIDGACKANGKPDCVASYGIFFGKNDPRNTCGLVQGYQSNNSGELTAALELYKIIEGDLETSHICICIDSLFTINCMSIKDWTSGKNKELADTLYTLYSKHIGKNISLKHVKGHTKYTDMFSLGNEEADKLAKSAITR